ncbi:MAG: hypothetical protein PHF00_09090 [Elusimicrobia bacterium]|nr:hypothetical protein [Elusimicrobiota bacterium]
MRKRPAPQQAELLAPLTHERLAAAGIGLVFFALYLFTLDMRANFDALISGAWVEAGPSQKYAKLFFPWNHFLFNLAGWAAFKLLRPWYFSGYRSLQVINALAAAGTVTVLFRFLLARTRSGLSALGWTCVLGLAHVFWRQGVGGEAYTMGGFWVLLSVVYCCRHVSNPSCKTIMPAALFAALAALFHTGNALACLPVLLALVLTPAGARRRRQTMAVLGVWAAACMPYAAVHELFALGNLRSWFVGASYAQRAYELNLASSEVWKFDVIGGLSSLRRSLLAGEAGAAVLAFLAVCLCLPWLDRPGRMFEGISAERKKHLLLFAAAFGGYFIFYSFWQSGNPIYWCAHAPLLCGGLGLLRSEASAFPRARLTALGAAATTMGIFNFTDSILPNRFLGNFPAVSFARDLGRSTPPEARFLITGVWSDLKVYLPSLARRKRIALELFLIKSPPEKALTEIARGLAALREAGGPVYMLSEFEDASNLKFIKDTWGVDRANLEKLVEPYRKVVVQRFQVSGAVPPIQSLVLLWPKATGGGGEERLVSYLQKTGFGYQARSARREPKR